MLKSLKERVQLRKLILYRFGDKESSPSFAKGTYPRTVHSFLLSSKQREKTLRKIPIMISVLI